MADLSERRFRPRTEGALEIREFDDRHERRAAAESRIA
jgi:hypothetical protein